MSYSVPWRALRMLADSGVDPGGIQICSVIPQRFLDSDRSRARTKREDHPGNGARCRTGHRMEFLPDFARRVRPAPEAGGKEKSAIRDGLVDEGD